MSKDSPRTSVLRDNDLIQKGQDDLIRRGDALALCDQYPYVEGVKTALHDFPAAQPTVSPELLATTNDVAALVEAAEAQIQYMDMCHDNGDLERNLRAALARVKSKEGFSNEKGVM